MEKFEKYKDLYGKNTVAAVDTKDGYRNLCKLEI